LIYTFKKEILWRYKSGRKPDIFFVESIFDNWIVE